MKELLTLIFTLPVFVFSGIAEAEGAREFRILGVSNPPLRYFDENGELQGIDVDIIKHIFESMEIPFSVELLDSSPRLIALWKSGRSDIDMVLTYSFKPDRAEYLQYAEESHIDIAWNFFVMKKNLDRIQYNSLSDLDQYLIGATTGFAYTKEFWTQSKNGTLNLDEVPFNNVQMKKLISGHIDTVPMNTLSALYLARKHGYLDKIAYLPKPLKTKPYFNTFVKSSDYPRLDEIKQAYDQKLRDMKTTGILADIIARYTM